MRTLPFLLSVTSAPGGDAVTIHGDRAGLELLRDRVAQPNQEVELSGWKQGALKVSATQAIRECSHLGLGAAKEAVDQCLSGTPVRVQTTSVSAARTLAAKLEQLGFVAKVTYGG